MTPLSPSEKLACPACGLELPEDDSPGQVAHMEAEHPEVIERRLIDAGFRRDAEGAWIDALAGNG